MNLTRPDERSFRTEREFNVPREHVWRAMTDPDLLPRWWARGNRMDVECLELRPGGHWRFSEHAPEGQVGFQGRFQDIQEPDVLEQTFCWDGMRGHPVLQSIRLMPLPEDRTRLVVTSVFHDQGEREAMLEEGAEQGLDQSYDTLERVLEQMGVVRVPRRSLTAGAGLPW